MAAQCEEAASPSGCRLARTLGMVAVAVAIHSVGLVGAEPPPPPLSDEQVEAIIGKAEAARAGLQVPFFMYDGTVGPIDFPAAFARLTMCVANYTSYPQRSRGIQEFSFIAALQSHPWRTPNPADAQVIVIPVATFDEVEVVGLQGKLEPFCPGYNARRMLETIVRTDLYQARKADHLLVAGHNFAAGFFQRWPWVLAQQQMVTTNASQRLLVSPYGTQAPRPGDLPPLSSPRVIRFFFGGGTAMFGNPDREPQGGQRLGYYIRTQLVKDLGRMPPGSMLASSSSPVAVCDDEATSLCADRLPFCYAADKLDENVPGNHAACLGRYNPNILKRVQFALCPRGDNPSSPRLYEAMQYGAIPILISDFALQISTPFQCWVPYESFTLSLREVDCFDGCWQALSRLAARLSSEHVRQMRRLVAHFRRDVLWRAPDSRVAENILLEAARLLAPASDAAGACPFGDRLELCVLDSKYSMDDHKGWMQARAGCGLF